MLSGPPLHIQDRRPLSTVSFQLASKTLSFLKNELSGKKNLLKRLSVVGSRLSSLEGAFFNRQPRTDNAFQLHSSFIGPYRSSFANGTYSNPRWKGSSKRTLVQLIPMAE